MLDRSAHQNVLSLPIDSFQMKSLLCLLVVVSAVAAMAPNNNKDLDFELPHEQRTRVIIKSASKFSFAIRGALPKVRSRRD